MMNAKLDEMIVLIIVCLTLRDWTVPSSMSAKPATITARKCPCQDYTHLENTSCKFRFPTHSVRSISSAGSCIPSLFYIVAPAAGKMKNQLGYLHRNEHKTAQQFEHGADSGLSQVFFVAPGQMQMDVGQHNHTYQSFCHIVDHRLKLLINYGPCSEVTVPSAAVHG